MTPVAYVSTETRVPVALPAFTVERAKHLMRAGSDLTEASSSMGVSRRDLDLSLWRYLGSAA
jgi:hypothetical protein